MTHCKHCIKICKTYQTCKDYQPYSIDVLEKEKRTATPERRKEIINELDFYYYGCII
jgi:hypothetical protein